MHFVKWLPLLLLLVVSSARAQSTPDSEPESPAAAPAEAVATDVPPPPEESTVPAPAEMSTGERGASAEVTQATAYSRDVEASVALRLELASVNGQQNAGNALYVTSAILAVLGTGAIAAGMVDVVSSLGRGGSGIGGILILGGAVLNIGHVVTMIIAACFDYGSASHRRKLLRDHPELAFELSPGPGDAGLGLTLRF